MNRRQYLKSSLMLGGSVLLPPGVLGLVGCSGTARPPELAAIDGAIMGTFYSVRLLEAAPAGIAEAIRTTLQNVDEHMSTWRLESELSTFNASTDGDWQAMSTATSRVIAHALDTSSRSGGAFDATVGPLVDLWGFGARATTPVTSTSSRPRAQAIRRTLAQVGHQNIEVDLGNHAVRKRHPLAQLDLSGIAKGHAVDRVAEALDAHGLESYLVEVGGELKARGRKKDGSAWRVAIEKPAVGRRDVFRVVDLHDRAIATSGDYRNFFDRDGVRYSHSIDPRIGRPVSHTLASVSVVADSTMTADALSTTLMVLGPDEAIDFAERHDVAAQLIVKEGASLRERQSSAFRALND